MRVDCKCNKNEKKVKFNHIKYSSVCPCLIQYYGLFMDKGGWEGGRGCVGEERGEEGREVRGGWV